MGRYAVSLCHAVLSWRMALLLSGSPGLGPRYLFFNLCPPSSHLSTTDRLAAILYQVSVYWKLQILPGFTTAYTLHDLDIHSKHEIPLSDSLSTHTRSPTILL